MNHSPASNAPDDEDGDGGGGHAQHARDPPPQSSKQQMKTRQAPTSAAHDDTGFVAQRSKKAKKQANAAKPPAPPAAATAEQPAKQGGTTASPRPARQEQARGKTARAPPTALEKQIMRLRDHVRMHADDQEIVDVLVRAQRFFRTHSKEQDPLVKKKFLRTYEYDDAMDRGSIARTMRDWFSPQNSISNQEFKYRLAQICIAVPATLRQSAKVSWRQAINDTESSSAEADEDDEMEAKTEADKHKERRWTTKPRKRTGAELAEIARLTRSEQAATTLPGFVKATDSAFTAALLTTVIAKKTRGILIAALEGAFNIPAPATQSALIKMISTDISGPSTAHVAKFKEVLTGARYDPAINAVVFSTATVADAATFAGTLLPIQGRMIVLKQPCGAVPTEPMGVPTGTVVDLHAYELQILNLAGQLDGLNVWHLFHGLLGLDVVELENALPGADGILDPTLWNISLKSRGCPAALQGKTKIVWGGEVVWLHHKAHYAHPPCTKCGTATHPARGCQQASQTQALTTLSVTGQCLDADSEIAAVAKVSTEDLSQWLANVEATLTERSSRAGGIREMASAKTPVVSIMPKQLDELETEELREHLVGQVTASAWIKEDYAKLQAQRPRTQALEELAPAQLQDLLSARVRSSEWRRTMEYAEARATFLARTLRTEEICQLQVKIQRMWLVSSNTKWLTHELSYRLPPAMERAPTDEKATFLGVFRAIMSRPAEVTDDSDERIARVAANVDTKLATVPIKDAALDDQLMEIWDQIRQHDAEERHRKLIDDAAAEILDHELRKLMVEIFFEELNDARGGLAVEEAEEPVTASPLVQRTDESQVQVPPPTAQVPVETESAATTSPTPVIDAAVAEHKRQQFMAESSLQKAVMAVAAAAAAAPTETAHEPQPGNETQVGPTSTPQSDGEDDWYGEADQEQVVAATPRTTGVRTTKKEGGKQRRVGRFSDKAGETMVSRRVVKGSISSQTMVATIVRSQLGITQYLSATPMEEETPDVIFARLKPAPPPPAVQPKDWPTAMQHMGLRMIDTPANGTCWEYSVHATQWGLCAEEIRAVGRAKREAEYLKIGTRGIMHNHYDELVEAQVISEDRFCQRLGLPTTNVTEAARAHIQAEIYRAGVQPCDAMIADQYWAQTDEIKVTALWLRQPIIVFDLDHDGSIAAQMHAIGKPVMTTAGERETVKTTTLSHEAAAKILDAYKTARVVPLLAVLDHRTRHFSGLRVEEARYEAHAFYPKDRAAMKKRLGTLLKSLGMYVPSNKPSRELKVSPMQTQSGDSSAYTPSDQSCQQTQLVPMRGPGVRDMVRLAVQGEDDDDDDAGTGTSNSQAVAVWSGDDQSEAESEQKENDDVQLAQQSPAYNNDSSPWDSSGSMAAALSQHSVPLHAASLVTPQSQIEDEEYIDLLAQLSRKGPVPGKDEAALAKAMRANKTAYVAWKNKVTPGNKGLASILAQAPTVAEACDALVHDTTTILDLLRTLPCVPVLAGRVRPDLFQVLGRDLMALGRARMLQRLANTDTISPEAQAFCSDWAQAFAGIPTAAGRWTIAQTQNRWDRLETYVPAHLRTSRSLQGLDDQDWGALLAHLLVNSSAVRDHVAQWDVADACDALLSWTAHDRRVYHTVEAARAFQDGRWREPTEYLRAEAVHPVNKGTPRVPQPSLPRGSGGSGWAIGVAEHDDAVSECLLRQGNGEAAAETVHVEATREPAPALVAATNSVQAGLQLMAQNVRGLAKTHDRPAAWFSALRALHEHSQVDAVVLQETRATAEWMDVLTEKHARAWGLEPAKLETPLSYWAPTPSAAGGVAILIHPHSKLRGLQPLWEEHWDAHFMALHGIVSGTSMVLVCVYAPTNKRQREKLFKRLRKLRPPGELIMVGGDFNCVLDEERDRSRWSRTNTHSAALNELLDSWRLVDTVAADLLMAQSQSEIQEFHAHAHTYGYRLRDGSGASSRLDRWYVSSNFYHQVAQTAVVAPACMSDHDAVVVTITPSGRLAPHRSAGRRAIVFPLAAYAKEAIVTVSAAHVEQLTRHTTAWTAEEAATQWDLQKTELRRSCLVAQRAAAKKLTNSIHQRIRRAKAALAAEKRRRTIFDVDGTEDAVRVITARMELLTLSSGERADALRRHLILLQHSKATRRQRKTIRQYDGQAPSATRAFFRRISSRFSRPRVVGDIDPDAAGRITAAQLAQDWQPIVQQAPATTTAQDAFFAKVGHLAAVVPSDDAEFVPFTAADVLAAIKACPAGKASGPDGVPNDWYKLHAQDLAPILATTFSQWVKHQILPPSFSEATIFCLPKVSAPRNGLDYRPISLLNTDYKIFSRLILQRVRDRLPTIVSPSQFGFVGHRQVHDAIDVWDAVQAMVEHGELPSESTAVMLDFAKAYDTLDRAFLRRALEFHGFTSQLVAVVDAMHLATTARFLADGEVSDEVDIHNGIRQGCPLAPVLFILALDVLYKAADNDTELLGLRVGPTTRITMCGYADDTTAYLASPREEEPLIRLLDEFGNASGLRINVQKSRALAVHPRGPTEAHASMVIPALAANELHRHLGMAVASTPSSAAIWSRTLQQVRATLHLAHAKTTNLLQRVEVARSIIMPKLLFVGRHDWPTSGDFTKLQRFVHQYVWHATLTAVTNGKRAWMSATVAALPVVQGGIGLPDVQAAFVRMSATVVSRWRNASNAVTAAAGAALLRLRGGGPGRQATGPSRTPPTQHHLAATMAATGLAIQRVTRATPREDDERSAGGELLPVAKRSRLLEQWWDAGWYHSRYDRHAEALKRLRDVQRSRYGDFSVAALLAAPVCGSDILHDAVDHDLDRRDFHGLLTPFMTIGDVIELDRVGPLHVKFRCRTHAWSLPPKLADAFKRLCDLVVHNYPTVLHPHNAADELQPRPPTHTVWRVVVTTDKKLLVCEPVPGTTRTLGPVRTRQDAARLARQHEPVLSFDHHPLLDAFAPLWTSNGTHNRSAAARPPAASTTKALAEVASRARSAMDADEIIGTALAQVSWKRVARLPVSASRQRLLLHKIKGLRLSGWDRATERRGCPHCRLPREDEDTGHGFHIMWFCPVAQELWAEFRASWARLGVTPPPADPDLRKAIFSLTLHATPAVAWSFLGRRGVPTETVVQVHKDVALVWQQQVLGCLQRIWEWRHGLADELHPWTATVARSALRCSFRAAFHQVSAAIAQDEHAHALRGLLSGLQRAQVAQEPLTVPRAPASTDQFLLFFDGGSRGNPGPGGAGAVIVCTDRFGGHPRIHWAAAMSLAIKTTTNNQAEYFGLVTGLQHAAREKLRPLTVVGDSAMVITQMRQHKAPLSPALRVLYGQARVAADVLTVTNWRHHVRAFNKMADAAANIAMDTRASVQTQYPTTRHDWAVIATHLNGDVEQWQASTQTGND